MNARSVAVLMGSDSDWKSMQKSVETLTELGIEADVQVLSAHRTPAELERYVKECPQRGIAVIVCGAGMSAALAGAVAAHTILPVIGVPLPGSVLGGMDALLSTVQMPSGVPVATMSIGDAGARNAAILAASILAITDEKLAENLKNRKRKMTQEVDNKNQALQRQLSRC